MSFALYTYKDVDGDSVSVFVADIPGEGRGVSIHSDRDGCSIPADEITNFIVGVIAAAGLEPDDITTLARAVLAAGDTGHFVTSVDTALDSARVSVEHGARSMRERIIAEVVDILETHGTTDALLNDVERLRVLPLLPDDTEESND